MYHEPLQQLLHKLSYFMKSKFEKGKRSEEKKKLTHSFRGEKINQYYTYDYILKAYLE